MKQKSLYALDQPSGNVISFDIKVHFTKSSGRKKDKALSQCRSVVLRYKLITTMKVFQ